MAMASNTHKQFEWHKDRRFLALVAQQVSKYLARPLTIQEKVFIVQTISQLDISKYKGVNIRQIVANVSAIMRDQIVELLEEEKKTIEPNPINMRDVLKREVVNVSNRPVSNRPLPPPKILSSIDINSLIGLDTVGKIQALLNPPALYEKNYIVLDSFNRNESITSQTRFQWNYADNANTTIGTVNTIGTIKNIVAMKLYQPVIPNIDSINVNSARVSILIEEFQAQSFIASSSRRYHFLTKVVEQFPFNNRYRDLQIEDYHDGVYKFRKPIVRFETLTVSFGDPIDLMAFPVDRYDVTFTYGFQTTINFPEDHNLVANEYIRFNDFTTNDLSGDSEAINNMNNTFGNAVVNIPTSTTAQINVDTSGITAIPGLTIRCFLIDRRFMFCIEFTYLKDY